MNYPFVPATYRRRERTALALLPLSALALSLVSVPAHAGGFLGKFSLPPFLGGQAGLPIDAGSIAGVALAKVLQNDLPVRLDASTIYPTVPTLPGNPFASHGGLLVTPESLPAPLAPGDYELHVFAYSLDNELQRPGKGVAYQFGPLQGHAAEIVSTLLWRSRLTATNPAVVAATVQAIESGLSYSRMPENLRQTVDQLAPDFKDALKDNYIEILENTYAKIGRYYPLPPLPDLLVRLGPNGKTALTAMRRQTTLQAQDLDDQKHAQVLFSGQESGVYTPVRPEDGPWTEKVPGRVYMRLKITGGAMAENVLQLRVLSQSAAASAPDALPTLMSLFGATLTSQRRTTVSGIVAYSISQPAQPLSIVPVLTQR